MADILSQDEVDALLSALSTGGIESPKEETAARIATSAGITAEGKEEKLIGKYDFRRPDIVSKDQMRTLQMLHKTFCRFLTTNLSTYLRTIVEVNLVAVDQLTYGEFNMSLSNPTCINVFSIKPMEGRAVLEINPVLVYTIIDRLLGGPGHPPAEIKALTDIEQSIISKVLDIFLEGLRESWNNIIQFDLRIEEREVNPQFVQVVAPGETVILISCEMKVGPVTGIASICFPFVYLEPIMSSLSAQHWIAAAQKKPTEDMKISLKKNLEKSSLTCSAILGKTLLTIRQLLELKKNDVIMMEQKVRNPLLVQVEEKNEFLANPGIIGKRKAVQLVSIVTENREEIANAGKRTK
ncbi:MAG: flagellar motor switch protein FliM [Candidatus Aureabacteria bacterium]|nr:flagellar motor switch protein FliM [Candidatus Auribacterota bacterium]